MRGVLVFVISNYSLSFLVLGLVVGVLVGLRRAGTMAEALLAYYLLGFGFLTNFVMHVFFQQTASRFIGWAPSPFETQPWLRAGGLPRLQGSRGLHLAAVTGPAMFLWGAAGGHVYHGHRA
jgi:hypothetical protein